ncbi:IS630 family transposase [Streptomyces sp. NPDC056224]|uniref:IS630 family transposase n=1 Tax=Streptomyces sp. NPDC056224 TaxID=3345750 RepID=UPI0035E010CE
MSDLVGDARHLSPSAQEALRLRAVAALVEGRDREEVAAVFRVSLKAVDGWWAKWLTGGRDALTARPRGKRVGEHQVLTEAEQEALRQAVLDHRPCALGLSGELWTRGQVGALIAKLYRVRLTEPGVGKYLKRWGLSFQRPDKRAVEQDPEAVRAWLEETWPAIRAKAKAEGGVVLFADQVGIRSDQVTGRTWGERGRTPIVRRTGNRFSVNAMSAISTKGRMHFMVFTETRRPQAQPAKRPPGPQPGRTRHGDPTFLPPTATPTPHCPRLLPRPPRPLHHRREPFEFLINKCGGFSSNQLRGAVANQYMSCHECLAATKHPAGASLPSLSSGQLCVLPVELREDFFGQNDAGDA